MDTLDFKINYKCVAIIFDGIFVKANIYNEKDAYSKFGRKF